MFQHRECERARIINIYEGFQEALWKVQTQEVGMISEGVKVLENMSLRILLSIWSKMDVLNNGLDRINPTMNGGGRFVPIWVRTCRTLLVDKGKPLIRV